MKKVILSTRLILGTGMFSAKEITKEQALAWLDDSVVNFHGHETVKILGLKPAATRETCTGYDEALVIGTKSRLDFGREYTVEEIEKIGVVITVIKKVSGE